VHSAQVCGASLCCQCVQRTCIVGVSSERLIICFLLSMCRASHNQASWSKLFYSSQLACIGPCALISFKFKFSKMRLETRATTEKTLHPSFGPPRGACHPPSAPRAEGGGSEAHFRHTLEPWKLSAALPQYHQQTGLTEKGLHEACVAKKLGSLKQPLRRPPARIPEGGAWTPRGGVDSSRATLSFASIVELHSDRQRLFEHYYIV
jgi:hypothetical protein